MESNSKDMMTQFVLGAGVLVPVFQFTYGEGWLMAAIHGIGLTLSFLLGGAGSRALRTYLKGRRQSW